MNMREIEEQRNGRNKDTAINHTYINSNEYRRKFDLISKDKKLNRLLYYIAKEMLFHRTGTLLEDMYWIDPVDMKIVAEETDTAVEKEIVYSEKTKKIVKNKKNLITIHSHPNSFPPSISDINSNFLNEYMTGIIICHDGRIYLYQAGEEISESYYKLVVEDYLKQGYDEDEAQRLTWKEFEAKFDVNVKEVTDNDV